MCGAESDGALALGVRAKAGCRIRDAEAWRHVRSVGRGKPEGRVATPPTSLAPTLLGLRLSVARLSSQERSPGSWGVGRLSSPQQLREEGLFLLFHRGRDSGSEGCPIHLGMWWAFEPKLVPCPRQVWDLQSEGQPSAGSPRCDQGRPPTLGAWGYPQSGAAPFHRWGGGGQTPPGLRLSRKVDFTSAAFSSVPYPCGFLV